MITSTEPMETKALAGLKRIRHFSQLEANWDGYGASELSDVVINRAIEFFTQLAFLPQVFPTPRNSVQFEYENDNTYVEVEVFDDHVELLTMIGGEENETTIESAQEVNEIIAQLNEPGFSRKSRTFVSGDTPGSLR